MKIWYKLSLACFYLGVFFAVKAYADSQQGATVPNTSNSNAPASPAAQKNTSPNSTIPSQNLQQNDQISAKNRQYINSKEFSIDLVASSREAELDELGLLDDSEPSNDPLAEDLLEEMDWNEYVQLFWDNFVSQEQIRRRREMDEVLSNYHKFLVPIESKNINLSPSAHE